MLKAIFVLFRAILGTCGGHRAVAMENVTLRQQVAALRRSVKRPQLRERDRLFWIFLAKVWPEWRTALVFVRPDTVLRWHRQWLRRRWVRRSKPARPGRPTAMATIRALVVKMAAANPLWGAPRIHGELRTAGRCTMPVCLGERKSWHNGGPQPTEMMRCFKSLNFSLLRCCSRHGRLCFPLAAGILKQGHQRRRSAGP